VKYKVITSREQIVYLGRPTIA